MPIQIQCTCVVIRNDALDRVLDGGAANFGSIAPNAMSYSDDRLSQASFMSTVDAEEYARSLELRGLDRTGVTPNFVIVNAHDRSVEPSCDWLVLFEYEHRLIATIRGSESRTVIAASIEAKYDPDAIQHYSPSEVRERLEFVERNGSIDTYRDKVTGKLLYHTRKSETAAEILERAFEVVWKLRREPGLPPRKGEEADEIQSTIENLQSLAAKHPESWKVMLALGMAWFALGKDDIAQRQMSRAAELEPDNATVLRELAAVCLVKGDFPKALDACTKAVVVDPDDVELLGNLAVIQLLNGDVAKAKATIQHALRLQPDDSVNANIQSVVVSVASGERSRPQTFEEMMGPPAPKKQTWLSRLLGRG